jgi:hypothetical protein
MSGPVMIRCSNCGEPTGAWLVSGDPYLPSIVCDDCVIHNIEDAIAAESVGEGL